MSVKNLATQIESTESYLETLTEERQELENNLVTAKTSETRVRKYLLELRIEKCLKENGKHDLYNAPIKWVTASRMCCRNCPYEKD